MIGAALAISVLSLGPLGLVLTAAAALFVGFRRPASWRYAFGLLSGIGALFLVVAWLQRDGPGTTCWQTATASGCDEHLNPLPWLALGIVFSVTGIVGQVLGAKR
jgi:Na+-transporting NADH:ubiquinone oxidoreductase subunit NqrB